MGSICIKGIYHPTRICVYGVHRNVSQEACSILFYRGRAEPDLFDYLLHSYLTDL